MKSKKKKVSRSRAGQLSRGSSTPFSPRTHVHQLNSRWHIFHVLIHCSLYSFFNLSTSKDRLLGLYYTAQAPTLTDAAGYVRWQRVGDDRGWPFVLGE